MKKICSLFFCILLMIQRVDAEYTIVLSDDDRILTSENEHTQRSIASITKIMTAILCLEKGDFIDVWNVGEEVLVADEKRIYLSMGQKVSMRSLLYGLLLESGNDAALVLAERVGGSVEHFVEMMNEKAKEIGMINTEFHNPHGLDIHEKGNLSTCYDMALLMKYALNNQMFTEIIHTVQYKSEWGSIFTNSNRLLTEYPFMIGGKTGYTSKAGRTLVTAARKDDLTLICVTLNNQNHFQTHQSLYSTLFNTYQKMILLNKGSYRMFNRIIEVDEDFTVTCSMEELSEAEIRTDYVYDTGEFIVQFQLNDYIISKVYQSHSEKRYCVLGWCL